MHVGCSTINFHQCYQWRCNFSDSYLLSNIQVHSYINVIHNKQCVKLNHRYNLTWFYEAKSSN